MRQGCSRSLQMFEGEDHNIMMVIFIKIKSFCRDKETDMYLNA